MPAKKHPAKNKPSKVKIGRLGKETGPLTAKERKKIKGAATVLSGLGSGDENPTESISFSLTNNPRPKP